VQCKQTSKKKETMLKTQPQSHTENSTLHDLNDNGFTILSNWDLVDLMKVQCVPIIAKNFVKCSRAHGA